jgi:tRNA-Thr(GGU) m(6)t(6)A37 methyltransferase TsaA
MATTFVPLGVIRTPFPDKYGVPRQPGLVPAAWGRLELSPDLAGATDGLDGISHVWLIWTFHLVPAGAGRNKVRPPRLGGNTRIGSLATRSPFRPNPIGLSVCRLVRIERDGGRATLVLAGVDLVDGTPVLDVKPYVPYVDRVDDARVDWVDGAPARVEVYLDPQVEVALNGRSGLRELVLQVLAQDPRPATHKAEHRHDGVEAPRVYRIRLENVEVTFVRETEAIRVVSVAE